MASDESLVTLYQGDCLEEMKNIPDGSVDMVMTDPPYGTTIARWDCVIPLAPMWEHLKRVIKPNGAIVMTASQPFTTALIASNLEMFKYCLVWEKARPSGFIHAKNKPLKYHEDICVWSPGTTVHQGQSTTRMTYNPQGLKDCPLPARDKNKIVSIAIGARPSHKKIVKQEKTGYPGSVLRFANPNSKSLHPTQKPVALMEYLIRTYTNKGETVLDFTMGSGTTGVAAKRRGRNFIGIELDPGYFEIATKRINETWRERDCIPLTDIFTKSNTEELDDPC